MRRSIRLQLLSVFLAACPVDAQRPLVEAFSVGEGLPSAAIYSLAQDAAGRLWIAGRGGVTSYDGRTFRTAGPPAGLPAVGYQAVTVDDQGRVWALTRREARVFERREEGHWSALPELPLSDLEATLATVLEVISENGETLVAVGTSRVGLWLWDGRDWQHLGPAEGLPSPNVTGVARHGGALAVGTAEGLCELRSRQLDCRRRGLDTRLAEYLLALHAPPASGAGSKLWIAGRDWFGSLDGDRLQILDDSLGLRRFGPSTLGAIAVDAAGGVYVGAPNSGWFWNPVERRLEGLGPFAGGAAVGVTALLVDREENVWVGSQRGLFKISSRRFLTFDREHGLLESEVSALAEPRPGLLVMGHNTGFTVLDNGDATVLPFRPSGSEAGDTIRVLDIAVDARGSTWLAAQKMGLLRLAADRTWNVVPDIARVSAVETDPRGRLWVVTGKQLLLREGTGFSRVETPAAAAGLPSFRWLAFGPDGRIYVTTRAGLLMGEDGRWQVIHGPTSEADNIYNLLAQPSGDVWIGTAAGLYQLREGRLAVADLGGRALERPVYQIFADRRGRLWFGTDDGVWRWDPPELRHFTVRHGLSGRETNRGAGFVDHRGRVWIGTDQGLSLYQEAYDHGPMTPPDLTVRALEIAGVSKPFQAAVDLNHRQNTFTVHFDVIALSREEKIEWVRLF